MRFNSTLKIISLSLSVAILSACSTTNGGKNGVAPVVDADAAAAQTAGLADQDSIAANKLEVGNQVYYFEFNKDDVQQDDLASLKVQADYLVAHSSARVRLAGNADERGSREYNVALGWRRAKAVAAVLEQDGVNEKQIAMLSYGKEKPVAFGHDEASFSLNRRVNLVYEAK
jgi:peptidoglycan-associated lipoprotein